MDAESPDISVTNLAGLRDPASNSDDEASMSRVQDDAHKRDNNRTVMSFKKFRQNKKEKA